MELFRLPLLLPSHPLTPARRDSFRLKTAKTLAGCRSSRRNRCQARRHRQPFLARTGFARTALEQMTEKDAQSLSKGTLQMDEQLSKLQEKLNKLTRAYLDELIDEESYQASQRDLLLEKTRLKQEKERLRTSRTDSWNEPAKDVINTLETLGKTGVEKSPQEISKVVHKVGTNRLISRKTVSFNLSEPYANTPSLLAQMRVTVSQVSEGENRGDVVNTNWCARQDLNLHALRHYHLKVACLPIPPRARKRTVN